MAERELGILVTARDMASRTLQNIGRQVNGLDRSLGRGMANIGRNLERGIVIGAAAAVGGLALAVREAGNFEASLRTINTVARLTNEDLTAVGEGIRAMARDTGTSLEDLTTGYYDLVSAGIAASQAQDVLRASNTLAIGGLATTSEGIDLITTALNSYGVAADKQGAEAVRFADIFAKSIERGKVTAADLASTFAQIAPLAAANNIEIEELAASYGLLTAKGVPAGEVATQMSSALIALMRRTGDLEKLEKQTGKSYLAIAGRKGLVAALEDLRKDAAKAGVPLIDLLGRVEGLNFVVNTTGPNLAAYNENLDEMGDSAGTAAAQMAERQQGLNFQLARLHANVKDAAIEIGTALIPELADLAGQATGWLSDHRDDVKEFAQNLAGGFRDAVAYLKDMDWAAIGGTLKTLSGVGKTILDTFLQMPSWVQVAVVSGWGLNKLTGGALGSIVGQLGAGLIKGILGMNAGVVNINAGVVNGGGGPGGGGGFFGGGGKGGGFLGTLARLGALAAAAAGVAGAVQQFEETRTNVVGPAREFVGDVVAGRANTSSLAELRALRKDLVGSIEMEAGDPLSDILKWTTVNPSLQAELAQVDAKIARLENAAATTRVTAEAQRDEQRQIRVHAQEQTAQARVSAARLLEAKTAISAGFAADAGWLSRIERKSFTANFRLTVPVTATFSVSGLQRRILAARVATGTISEF